jgi:hypothetical protein
MSQPLTQEYLLSVFEYRDGELYWKVDRRKTKVGQKAGRRKANGYCEVRLDNKLQGTHRLIFLMTHGYLPSMVDHIDGNPSNNLIENLRGATSSQNQMNSKLPANNKSGFKGIYMSKHGKWIVQCVKDGVNHRAGSFSDIRAAAEAMIKLREELHGEFSRVS